MIADVLIAPLKVLIATLGTGDLPTGATAALAQSTQTLGAAADQSERTMTATSARWRGTGADAAAARVRVLAQTDRTVGDDGADVATVIAAAAAHVKAANTELNGLVDSFVAAAGALGSVATPAGLAALVPLALDHIERGVAVVRRAQTELADDTAALERHRAPAEVSPRGAGPTSVGGTGTQVVLPDGTVVQAPNERAARAVRAALSVQGTPYVWGGTTTDGFDCSGFTQWAYRQAGLDLPRLAQDQDLAGVQVSQSELMPGDLAVWSGHVAMYIGNNQFVETGGDPVGVTPLRTTNAGQTFEGFYRPR
ncbi:MULTISPECIES: C40 family peptidase [Gordonia]|uniref:NlpC/P60 domain-containing protein n=1 Tax=Gordonia malaquae NBRC 108250 TaxID=1223542 RepID=M3VBR2_GORML|nr:C40 family peptidase [Gordonia malaquae]GAC80708.1 hypothetical protein GM1_020_00720 [Gordonia malaquae NBRC 108250]SEC20526.1 Cell wall-associated hydrolase, NlpC family [Gordonia malaquae]